MADFVWWKHGVVYQVYPRSFQDTNGDGVGDLKGISERLDYLAWLGVDAIWISPIYPSPMADFGYDVSDYCNIDPLFGSLDDFDRLVAEAHAHKIKISSRFRSQPHVRAASVVSRKPGVTRQSETRLVHLARRQAGRFAAEQLAVAIRRTCVGT